MNLIHNVMQRLSEVDKVTAANQLSWEDMKQKAKALAKKLKVDWEDVQVRRLKKNTRTKTFKVGDKKYRLEAGDLFMFLEDEDDIYLFVEGMKKPYEMTNRMYDVLYDASTNLKKPPKEKTTRSEPNKILPVVDQPARKKSGSKPTQAVEDIQVKQDTQPIVENKSIEMSMLPNRSTDKTKPVSREEYDQDNQLGFLYAMHGGYSVYLIGAGPRIKQEKRQPGHYAIYVDKTGAILRSNDPVDLKKPGMSLRTLKLDKRLSYEQYESAYKKCAEHIRDILYDCEESRK